MTMALRVPTLENTCGPVATGTHTAAMSSSGPSTLRLGPTKNSLIGMVRLRVQRGHLDLGPGGHEGRVAVAGGRRRAEVAPDGAAVADRRRAHGARRHGQCRAGRRPRWAMISR